jgi:tetraacyldisaccharide 4'-kinase
MEVCAKTYKWLLPAGWIYGFVVSVRNRLYDFGIMKSRSFPIPVISVGNVAVGGTGKTPHVEYILELLRTSHYPAVLSRGYKRRSKGFVLASKSSTAADIGDEPLQIKTKFPDVLVAVDADRCHGIDLLMVHRTSRHTDVIVLDDAFQHRRVRPGLNIVLVEYGRTRGDHMLPAGRLREPMSGLDRADMVVVTKCPPTLTQADIEATAAHIRLRRGQPLYFSTMEYQQLEPLFCGDERTLESISQYHVLLVTGIAQPTPLLNELKRHTPHVKHLSFGDHHEFSAGDIRRICADFEALPQPRMVVTTEKDAARLTHTAGLTQEVRQNLFLLPIRVRILNNARHAFDNDILHFCNSPIDKEKKEN